MANSGKISSEEVDSVHLAAIVRSSNDAIVSKSTTGVVRTWNDAAQAIFGYTAEEMIGQPIRRLIPEDRQHEEDEILARILRGEDIRNFETVRLRRDGAAINVSVTISPIFDKTGNVIGASKIARDITAQVAMNARLQESEERFRTLADNVSQFTWMADKHGYIFWYNKRWHDYTGKTLEQTRGWGWREVHHPDHVDRVVEKLQRSWDTGEPWEDTFPLRAADGTYRWFLSRALPIRDEAGRIVRWFGSNTDVTEQIEREEQVRLLMAEVNHRAKNLLGVVQAIARQTAGDADSEFLSRFRARLQALAANQDVLINSGWRGGDVTALVRSQLGHFEDAIGSRIMLDGPPVMLKATAAQALGMALHELATNAGKYGALSNESGRVDIRWRVEEQGDAAQGFFIEWIESGGPSVNPPERTGFGTVVIERMSKAALNGSVTLDYAPEGLRWRLVGDRRRALEESSPPFKRGPFADGAAHAASAASLSAAPAINGAAPEPKRSVLLVEDDAIIGMDLATRLEDAGFSVVGPAVRVSEALDLIKDRGCDVALLDINLGEETSEPIAVSLAAANIPFITISAYAASQRADALKGAPHLTKPLRTEQLLTELRKSLQ